MLRRQFQDTMSQYKGLSRSKVFRQFNDADFYYKNDTVSRLRSIIEKAGDDEPLMLEASFALFDIVGEALSLDEKKRCFNECLLPLSEIVKKDSVKGDLWYDLGRKALELQMDHEATGYFESAIQLDGEKVVNDENVFRYTPSFLLLWLETHLGKPGMENRSSTYEKWLVELLEASENSGDAFLRLSRLYAGLDIAKKDKYFKLSIRHGCEEAVNDKDSHDEKYENDFILLFERICDSGVSPIDAKKKCFDPLWSANEEFLISHHTYVTALLPEYDVVEASTHSVECAKRGMKWAEDWILERINNAIVQSAITDDLIRMWYGRKEIDIKMEAALGLLLSKGRGVSLAKSDERHICLSRYYLGCQTLLSAIGDFVECKRDAIKSEPYLEERYNRLELDLKRNVLEHYKDELLNALGCENIIKTDSNITNLIGCPKINGGKIVGWQSPQGKSDWPKTRMRPDDVRILSEYYEKDIFPGITFRNNGDSPLYGRYLFLRRLSRIVCTLNDSAVERCDLETLGNQKPIFDRLAEKELHDAMFEGDMMAMCGWAIHFLFSDDRHDNDSKGLLVILSLAMSVRPDECRAPFILLLAWLTRQEHKRSCGLKMLEWLADVTDGKQLGEASALDLEKLVFKDIKK